jgi:hypothetical protein
MDYHHTLRSLAKIGKSLIILITLLLLFLVEDALLWHAPKVWADIADYWPSRQSRLGCEKVHVGMTKQQALQILLPSTRAILPPSDQSGPLPPANEESWFQGTGSSCVIQWDATGQTVEGSQYVPKWEGDYIW